MPLLVAPQRILVLTYPAFRELLVKKLNGALAPGVTIACVPLPEDMQQKVDAVMRAASKEVTPAVIEAAAEAEATDDR